MTDSINTRTPDQPIIGTANDPSGAVDREASWSTGPPPEKQPLPAGGRDDSGPRAPARSGLKEPVLAVGLPSYRAIVAVDIERSTSRPDPVKAELRNKTYELFDAALYSAGIRKRHRDRYIDRGDGLLALIHPVDRAPKALLLNRVIPALSNLLADHNASLPHPSRLQRQLRVRVVTHAGDVRYDANGCFGETLDVAFRLLDAAPVKRALRETANPLVLVISGDIYSSVVRHSYDGIDQRAFHPLVRIQIAGRRYPGWIHIPGTSDAAHYPDRRLPALLHSRQQIRFTVASRPADASKAPVIYSSIHSNSARRTERPAPERRWLVGIKPKIVHIGGSARYPMAVDHIALRDGWLGLASDTPKHHSVDIIFVFEH